MLYYGRFFLLLEWKCAINNSKKLQGQVQFAVVDLKNDFIVIIWRNSFVHLLLYASYAAEQDDTKYNEHAEIQIQI